MSLLILTATFATGCNKESLPQGAKKTSKVTVTVTYKGAPVEGATVTFVNTDGPPSANGRTDAQGKARLKTYLDGDGATLGSHKVIIEKSEAVGGQQNVNVDSPEYNPNAPPATVKYHLPSKYNSIATSGLTADVKDGPNEFTFDLKD
ncbi:MAG TPA: hypothetical protein VGI40_28310 [Pirellulaceae bacterium]